MKKAGYILVWCLTGITACDKNENFVIFSVQNDVQPGAQVKQGRDPSAIAQIAAQIAGQLAGLKFSREYETEADEHSVDYLSKTDYALQ